MSLSKPIRALIAKAKQHRQHLCSSATHQCLGMINLLVSLEPALEHIDQDAEVHDEGVHVLLTKVCQTAAEMEAFVDKHGTKWRLLTSEQVHRIRKDAESLCADIQGSIHELRRAVTDKPKEDEDDDGERAAARRLIAPPQPPANAHDWAGHLIALKAMLLRDDDDDDRNDGGAPAIVGVVGGIDKTVLAQMLAADAEIRSEFPDGMFWLTLPDKTPSELWVLQRQRALCLALDESTASFDTIEDGAKAVASTLDECRCLIVLDNVGASRDAEVFGVCGSSCRASCFLLTAADDTVPAALNAAVHRIDRLDAELSKRLIAASAGVDVLPDAAARIVELGLPPLALALVGGMLQSTNVVQQLETGPRDITHILDLSVAALAGAAPIGTVDRVDRLLDLGVFPEDEDVPIFVLCELWTSLGADEEAVESMVDALVGRCIVSDGGAAPGCVRLPSPTRDDLRQRAGAEGLIARHGAILSMYRARCDAAGDGGGWARGPVGDGYFAEHLVYHLKEAGQEDEMEAVLLDYEWIAARLEATGVLGVLADYAHCPPDGAAEARLAGDAVRLSLEALRKNPAELGWQLSNRLMGHGGPRVATLVQRARGASGLVIGDWPVLTTVGRPLVQTVSVPCRIMCASALDNGRHVVMGTDDGDVALWSLATGQRVWTTTGHAKPVTCMTVLSAASGHIATGSEDGTLRAWDTATGTCAGVFDDYETRGITSVASFAGGRRIVSGDQEGTVTTWDVASGQRLRVLEGHSRSVNCVAAAATAAAADGCPSEAAVAVSGSADKTLRVWDPESGQCPFVLMGHEDAVSAVAVFADGRRAISGSSDSTLRTWDVTTGSCLNVLRGAEGRVCAVAVDAANRRAVSGEDASGDPGSVRLWDIESGTCEHVLGRHHGSCTSVSLLDDGGHRCLTTGWNGSCLWDMDVEAPNVEHEMLHATRVTSVAALASGRQALSGYSDKTLKLWDHDTGICQRTFHHDDGPNRWREIGVALLPNDAHHALSSSTSFGPAVRLWDLASGECVRSFKGFECGEEVTGMCALNDTRMATTSHRTRVRIWDMASGACLYLLKEHTDRVNDVVSLGDGVRVVSCSDDATIRVWDAIAGLCLAVLRGHDGAVDCLASLNDGRCVVSDSKDHTLRVWDAVEETCLRVVKCSGDVRCIAALSDSRHIAVCFEDDSALTLYDTETGTQSPAVHFESAPRAISATSRGNDGGEDVLVVGFATGSVVSCVVQGIAPKVVEARAPGNLIAAALADDVAACARLLASGAVVDQATETGVMALHIAAGRNNEDIAARLLAMGANIEAAASDMSTPLHSAAWNDHTAMCHVLAKAGADVNTVGRFRLTPFFIAFEKNNLALCELFVKAGADPNIHHDDHGTPLTCAVEKGHMGLCELLLKAGANACSNSLRIACRHGNMAICTLLLKAGASVEQWTWYDGTALHIAAIGGHAAICELLLKAGADASSAHHGHEDTPLHCAVRGIVQDSDESSFKAICGLLLKAGADVNALARDACGTPLHYAVCDEGCVAACEILLSAGANPSAVDRFRTTGTPLHAAARSGRTTICEMLCKAGADTEIVTKSYNAAKNGMTALSAAARSGHTAICEMLLGVGMQEKSIVKALDEAVQHGREAVCDLFFEAGAEKRAELVFIAAEHGKTEMCKRLLKEGLGIEETNEDGKTPLFVAAEKGHEAVCQLLIEAGADTDKASKDGTTPLQAAVLASRLPVCRILLEAGADVSTVTRVAPRRRFPIGKSTPVLVQLTALEELSLPGAFASLCLIKSIRSMI